MPTIECVPNISEGRRLDVIGKLTDSLRAVPGMRVLDVQSDATHNRSVFTLAGTAEGLAAGIPVLFEGAIATIDLRSHTGEHPRLGAVDVVPFIPIEGVTMAACVQLAKAIAADVATRFALPIYLYEEASSNAARKNLEDIRRGEFEGLAAKMTQPAWAPDYGPASPHAQKTNLTLCHSWLARTTYVILTKKSSFLHSTKRLILQRFQKSQAPTAIL